jgi:DNA-binding transcriptional ArsR family regulator
LFFFDYSTTVESNTSRNIEMEVKYVIAALAALAQETRLAVFRLLVQAGPGGLAAMQIAEGVGIAPSLLSFHLKELMHAGLISQTREGRSLIYAADFEAMNGVLGFLTENCCGGNVCSPVRVSNCSREGACS